MPFFQVTAISKTLKTTVYADYMRSIFQKGVTDMIDLTTVAQAALVLFGAVITTVIVRA